MWKLGKNKDKTTKEKSSKNTKEVPNESKKIKNEKKGIKIEKINQSDKCKNGDRKDVNKSDKSLKIAFNILAIFCLTLFCISIVPKGLQNDTFYTIKLGQQLRETGVDYVDHYSWHENLPYMYPHWLYDIVMSLVYDFMGGFNGIYISTIILSVILGILLYNTNKKISKNYLISFLIAFGQMVLMRNYITARAQLVTFILFVLTIIFIEKFLEKPKVRYAIALLLIPLVIANVHSAVFPFYFVLYLPYIGEYAIRVIVDWHIPHKVYQMWIKHRINVLNKKLKKAKKEDVDRYQNSLLNANKNLEFSNTNFESELVKQNDRRKKPYKIILERNDNTRWLIIIMVVCVFTGLLTPIKDMPYMYTYKIMQGNTTQSISEHLPLTITENIPIFVALAITIILAVFTKVKLRLRDVFMLGGLTYLAFVTRRQVSMLVLFGGFVLARMIAELFERYDKNGTRDFMEYMTTMLGEILTIVLVFIVSFNLFRNNTRQDYINENSYPVEAAEWIKENLDYKDIKLFNDYNYGSYLLFKDIPVFIDSRCDLYTPEFNGNYDKEKKKYVGKDVFSDFINISSISTYYDNKFEEYGITHVITKNNSKLKMLISRDSKYNKIYEDNAFIIYEREEE